MNNYQEYLNSEGWKAKRAMILNMWGNRCAVCNEGGELHLHHRTYDRKGNEDPFDVIPLCKKHHELIHNKTPVTPANLENYDSEIKASLIEDFLAAINNAKKRDEMAESKAEL